jgi:hypothetical protein
VRDQDRLRGLGDHDAFSALGGMSVFCLSLLG